jgi:hypothetical protein
MNRKLIVALALASFFTLPVLAGEPATPGPAKSTTAAPEKADEDPVKPEKAVRKSKPKTRKVDLLAPLGTRSMGTGATTAPGMRGTRAPRPTKPVLTTEQP